MAWPLRGSLDGSSWRGVATGIVFFIGIVAVIGGLTGTVDSFITESLVSLGAASLVVLVGSVGSAAVASRRRRATATSSREGGFADTDGAAPPLVLYQSEGCPYCRRVRRVCSDLGLSLVIHNPRTSGTVLTGGTVTNDHRYDELVGYGQDQLPLLVDTARDEAVYESDAIIAYLDDRYG